MKFVGEILRRKGDAYLVDCCVTASNEGTADDPKFPLKKLAFSLLLQDWLDMEADMKALFQFSKVIMLALTKTRRKRILWRGIAQQMDDTGNHRQHKCLI
jgi:hypothetical protein